MHDHYASEVKKPREKTAQENCKNPQDSILDLYSVSVFYSLSVYKAWDSWLPYTSLLISCAFLYIFWKKRKYHFMLAMFFTLI